MPNCSVEMCGRIIYATGLCKKQHNSAFLARHPKYANESRKKYRERYPQKMKELHRRISGRFSSGKTQAKRRGVPWTLTIDEHKKMLGNPCFWCGGVLNETGSGLDRLDNRNGYELGNVVPSCWSCNVLKGRIEGLGFIYPRTGELMRELMNLRVGYSNPTKEIYK